MGFRLQQREDGIWEWECFQSAYGYVCGEANTLPKAKIELAIAEAELMEEPYPPKLVAAMRNAPEEFAKDFPDPPYEHMLPVIDHQGERVEPEEDLPDV